MITSIHLKKSRPTGGFSLTEVTIAIGIVAFGLLVLFGLLPTGLNVVRESSDESIAVNILTSATSDISATPKEGNTSSRFSIPTKVDEDAEGQLYFDEYGNRVDTQDEAIYRLRWQARPRNAGTHTPPNILLQVAWPAAAPNPSGLVESLIVLPSHG